MAMRIVGVIPARYGSTRLEGKPLVDIHGKPMVQHVYECARKSRYLEVVLVATDDVRIQDAVEGFGGKVVMTSAAHPTGTDRVAEAVRDLDVDIIVNIQGDEPLLDPILIDECIEPFRRQASAHMATVMKRIDKEAAFSDPAVVKVVRDLAGRALYFSRSLLPYPRNRTQDFKVYEHIGIYAFTKDCLLRFSELPPTPLERIEGLEQLRALENGIPIHVVETQCECELVSVDTPTDLERARCILALRQKRGTGNET
jgi:3-deoxy-manno-octulosonate cytidylyltransferase (CMP-KDO synthetase)